MTTQQLPNTLPPGWESDYDGTSERWYFVHRPTGFSQFFFPKAGDETTRIAELAQPQAQPTSLQNGSLTTKMEAMTLSGNVITVTSQEPDSMQQPVQSVPQPQSMSPQTTQSPQLQNRTQGSPIARTLSQNVARKAVPGRRDSVQSQVSTRSAQSTQSVPQHTQQAQHVYSAQIPPQTVQNYQQTQQVPAQHSQNLAQVAQLLPGQTAQQTEHPQLSQSQKPLQFQSPQQVLPQTQIQLPQQYQQVIVNGQIMYQLVQPMQTLQGQPSQPQPAQSPLHSPQSHGAIQQSAQQHSKPQQIQQARQYQNTQILAQDTAVLPQNSASQQTPVEVQRRFSTIPVMHQPQNGQVSISPPPAQQQMQGTRHASIPLNHSQHQSLMSPGQPMQNHSIQQLQNGPASVTHAPQKNQPVAAAVPSHLPPPAPGMQWVLVQPGSYSTTPQQIVQPVQVAQQTVDPNKSPDFSVQMQQYGGAANVGAARPGLVNRLSSGSRKALEQSKGFVKKNPGKSLAFVGGLGLVAEACGVNVITDAVAGSKVYANVQAAKNRRKLANATQQAGVQQPQTVNLAQPIIINGIPHAPEVHGQQQHPHATHQQQFATHPSQTVPGYPVSQPTHQGGPVHAQQSHGPQIPVQQLINQHPSIQQSAHHYHPQQQQQQQPSQQFNAQQNFLPSTNPSIQTIQGQNGQPQYVTQDGQIIDSSQFAQNQTSPQYITQQNASVQYVQYYQPLDNLQPQYQQQNPLPFYTNQDPEQNSLGGSGDIVNYASDAYNMLPNGRVSRRSFRAPHASTDIRKGNQSRPQSPSTMTPAYQQLPTPASTPFDATQQFLAPSPTTFVPSQQPQQVPSLTTSPYDPAQTQQFSIPTPQALDPTSLIPQQQIYQDPSSALTAQIIAESHQQQQQQLTNDLLTQSILNTTIMNDNTCTTTTCPTSISYIPDQSGLSLLNASIQNDSSYTAALDVSTVSYTPAPELTSQSLLDTSIMDDNSYITSTSVNTGGDGGAGLVTYQAMVAEGEVNSVALISGEDDMDSAIF